MAQSTQSGRAHVYANEGAWVAGKYQLVRLLGRGSMGEVWLAHHRTLRENVALKLLTVPSPEDDPFAATTRFRFEAQVAARLSRKTRHIVRVTDHGETEGLAYLTMELLEGKTLENKLLLADGLPATEVLDIVTQIARALQHAHAEGVVHRDLKPSNVFLTRDEDGALLVKVLDFGIARVVHSHLTVVPFATEPGVLFGTPGYMGPEQAFGQSLDLQCDLWALATIAYEALTGELPVDGVSAPELLQNIRVRNIVPVRRRRAGLPAGLDAFFERAFAESPKARFPSASDLVDALERALRSHASLAGPSFPPNEVTLRSGRNESKPTPVRPPVRSRLPRAAAIAGACMLVVGLFSTASLEWWGARAETRVAAPAASLPPPEPLGSAASSPAFPAPAASLSAAWPAPLPSAAAVAIEPPASSDPRAESVSAAPAEAARPQSERAIGSATPRGSLRRVLAPPALEAPRGPSGAPAPPPAAPAPGAPDVRDRSAVL